MGSAEERPLSLEDLIDLELLLQEDRGKDPAAVRRRDAAIGKEIDAREKEGPPLFLAWLDVRRKQEGTRDSPGRQMKLLLEVVALGLSVLGLTLGGTAVSGWLRYDPSTPVNVIFFWTALVGSQLLLLVF